MLNLTSTLYSFRINALATIFAASIPFSTQALVLPVTQDAIVNTAKPDTVNAISQKLAVDAKQSTVLNFNYAALPNAVSSSQVAKATLRIWVNAKKGLN